VAACQAQATNCLLGCSSSWAQLVVFMCQHQQTAIVEAAGCTCKKNAERLLEAYVGVAELECLCWV
jgi:hypothetical protein